MKRITRRRRVIVEKSGNCIMKLILVRKYCNFVEMYSIVELVGIYGETNINIIKNNLEHTNSYFRTISDLLLGIKNNLENLPV